MIYPEIDTRLFIRDPSKAWKDSAGKPLTAAFTLDVAKELIGWQEESGPVKFGNAYLLTDKYGKKIRCVNNLKNRPFYPRLADDWMLEVLRQKWRFNGETIIIDKYGMVHDGQHRIIGLILAVQEWELDRKRSKPDQKWQEYWKVEPAIDALIVLGIEGDDDTVNTIGTGKPRTLTDVLYRCKWFSDKTDKVRETLSRITAAAIKLLWNRTAQNLSSFAPRRPHSESLEFITRHERILECVKFIHEEGSKSGEDERLIPFIQLGYASGLLYLMGCSASDPSDESNKERYDITLHEQSLDWTLWDKACDFWVDIASNGKATELLREALLNIPADVGGGYEMEMRCGMVIKGWNLFSDGKKITMDGIQLETGLDSMQRPIIAETPRLGGIDVYSSPNQEE